MPLGEKLIHKQTFVDGMNSDNARELMPNTQARYILNCHIRSSLGGNEGIVTNIKGTTIIDTPLPDGYNKTIGTASDEENGRFSFMVYNDQGFHTVLEYDEISNTVRVLLTDILDTGGEKVLNFDLDWPILHASYYKGIIYLVDGLNDARKINRAKCLDKSTTGYGGIIRREFLNQYKPTSIYPPSAIYISDTSKPFNRFYGLIAKYAQRYVYADSEVSVLSDWSAVNVPDKEPSMGINSIPTNNNGTEITVETGSSDVEFIEIFMQTSISDVDEVQGILNWKKIVSLDKKKLNIPNDTLYRYTFYNDENYQVISATEVMQPQSFMMKRPRCQVIAKDVLVHANGYIGNEKVIVNASVALSYSPLFIDSGAEEKYNSPQFVIGPPFKDDYVSDEFVQNYKRETEYIDRRIGTGPARFAKVQITVGADVKKGNKFYYTASNGKETINAYYEATLIDNAITVANAIKAQLIATGRVYYSTPEIPGTDIHANTIDLAGNVSFSVIIKAGPKNNYMRASAWVTPVLYSTLKDTGVSIKSEKMGSRFRLYYEYIDPDGRKSGAFTDDALLVSIDTENAQSGKKGVKITLTTNHRPPMDAEYFQILRSEDLSRRDFTQFLVQKIVNVPTANTSEYLDLVLGSYYTYFKLHPNSTINYQFEKGDRISFLRKIDGTYYPFFETEVIMFKDIVDDIVKQNVTTNGTNEVTVAQSSSDNVGKFIVINGSEREIIGVSGGNKYILNSQIGGTDPATYLFYNLVDRRGVLRIRKPAPGIITLTDNTIVEVYKPSLSAASDNTCFEIQQKYPILNPGTANAYHGGNIQNQSNSQPSIIEFNSGSIYVRNREMPLNNTFPGTQVIIGEIEDTSYSDFYGSRMNDYGRPNGLDSGKGIVHVGSRIAFSGKSFEGTNINGFNNFKNLNREDYNDDYGDIMLLVFDFGRLLVYKQLRTGFVTVDGVITEDANGQALLVNGGKFLNPIRYYAWEGGIGNNPESHTSNGTHKYYVSTNSGVIIRFGGNGEEPISNTFFLDDETRNLLSDAAKNKAKIFGGFDRSYGYYIIHIEGYEKFVYFDGFTGWIVDEPPLLEDVIFEIVTPPSHGTFDLTERTYTPNENYLGHETFSYRAFINGEWSQPKNICIDIVENTNRDTEWRAIGGSCQFNEDGERTGLREFSTLEQYYIVDGTATGLTKPNEPSDVDYVNPLPDAEDCFPTEWVIDDSESFCEQTVPPGVDFVWAELVSANPERKNNTGGNNGGTFADLYIKTYKGSSGTVPPDRSVPFPAQAPLSIRVTYELYYPGSGTDVQQGYVSIGGSSNTYANGFLSNVYKRDGKVPLVRDSGGTITYHLDGTTDFGQLVLVQTIGEIVDPENTGFLIQPQLKKQVKPVIYDTLSDFPTVGADNVFYKAQDTGIFYVYTAGEYVVQNPDVDINNDLCSDSGLPVATKANPPESDTYRVLNTGTCAIDPSEEVNLNIEGFYNLGESGAAFEFNATVTEALDNDLTVTFTSTYIVNGFGSVGPSGNITIIAGQTIGSQSIPTSETGTVTEVTASVQIVSPNPNGSKTIIY